MCDARAASSSGPTGEREPTPDFLIVGHITRDLLPDGSSRLGGTALYAALAAQRLGQRVGVVTSAPPDLLAELRVAAPGVAIAASLAHDATTFQHVFIDGARLLYLKGRANPLSADDIPVVWRAAPIVLLAPLAGELAPALADVFLPTAFVAATAQGWLRRTDADGAVIPRPLDPTALTMPHLRALILSYEDVIVAPAATTQPSDHIPASEDEAEALFAAWSRHAPLVVATRGPLGAALWRDGAPPERYPGYHVAARDTTGAGDVFAAAFLIHLRETDDPRAAMDFANRCAALSVEGEGPSAIPTRDEVIARFEPLC